MTHHHVDRAGSADIPQLAEVVAAAFRDLPPSVWLIPDPTARAAAFPAYLALYLEHAVREGVVHTTPDREAAAIWLPTPPALTPPLPDYDTRLAAATGASIERFVAFDATLDKHHPTTAHHWLAILAVAPHRQGHGIGTALLQHYHHLLDQQNQPAYLEAANLPDRDWYRARGWHDVHEPFTLPDNGPPMFPMWREPDPDPGVGRPQ